MKKVLIIDDDPDVLENLKLILSEKGFEIDTLTSPSELYFRILSFDPHIILLDVNLDNSDGRNICKGLKNHFRTTNIPVILFSGEHNLKDHYKECMAEDFFEKPLDITKLVDRLNEFFSTPPHKMSA